MLLSILATSTAFLSLTGFGQAIPQNGYGGYSSSAIGATATSATVVEAAASTSTGACNNSPELCSRDYNNITYIGAHDSAFLRDQSTGFTSAGNQFYNVTVALSAGIRMIQAQVHNLNGTLELCHTSCALLDGGSLVSFLGEIKTWMDANTNEVVTLLLVNSDDESAATFGADFKSSGIDTYGYTPTSTTGPVSTWPTLQTLITANTRLITFIASITYSSTYPYLLSEFDYVFETAFGVTSIDAFNCTLNRPTTLSSASAASASGYMGLANHFLDQAQSFGITVPDVANITNTNSASMTATGALGRQAEQCENEWGTKPTFILVDFFNVGPSIDTGDIMNGILGATTGRTNVSTAILTAANSGSSSAANRVGGAMDWEKMWWVLGMVALANWVCL